MNNIGMENIRNHEEKLTQLCLKNLKQKFAEKIKILGPTNTKNRGGIVSFSFDKYHPHDVAQILADDGICVRAGHHCAMPLHQRLKIPATVRASFYIYNDEADINRLVEGLMKVKKILS